MNLRQTAFLSCISLSGVVACAFPAAAAPKPKAPAKPPAKAKAAPAKAVWGPAIGPDKKLIKWGQDSPTSAYLRKNIREMEKWNFDGICIDPDLRRDGKTAFLSPGHLFSTRRFTYEELRHIVDDVKATKFTRFTDNFLVMGMCVEPLVFRKADWSYDPATDPPMETVSSPDWFNDAEFQILVDNWVLAARICREAGLKGFMIDMEQWGSTEGKTPRPWNYRFLRNHNGEGYPSFEVCARKWRERGKQLMTALVKEYPSIVMLNYQGSQQFSYDGIRWAANPDPKLSPLANADYGLCASFIDGLLAGIPANSKATFVDGGPLYHATLSKRYQDYRNVSFKGSLKRSAVPAAFKKHARLGFATWVDGRGYLPYDWSQKAPYFSNQFTPAELEHSLYFSLLNSDKYSWIWSEKAIFFPQSGKAQIHSGSKVTVPDEYRRAIANVKKPHRLDFQRDDRGALAEPLPPRASQQPGYSDAETFEPVADRYQFLADLPRKWWFNADREGLGPYPVPFQMNDWDLNGWNWKNWDKIEIGEYFQNRGYRFKGNAWYRVNVDIPASLSGKPLYLVFGGITQDPTYGAGMWMNNGSAKPVTGLPETFKGAVWDITDIARPGQENALIVNIRNYSGPGGIYKTVKLATSKPN